MSVRNAPRHVRGWVSDFWFTSPSFRVLVLLTLRLGNAERSTECCVPVAACRVLHTEFWGESIPLKPEVGFSLNGSGFPNERTRRFSRQTAKHRR